MSDTSGPGDAKKPIPSPGDILASAEAKAAGDIGASKMLDQLKASVTDVSRETLGQLIPPQTPRHRRRPKF